jgi:hypothetical protein
MRDSVPLVTRSLRNVGAIRCDGLTIDVTSSPSVLTFRISPPSTTGTGGSAVGRGMPGASMA